MKYAREDTVCLVTKVDGIKCSAVYTLDWYGDSCRASVQVTFPRAVVDDEFDLNSSEELFELVPMYVERAFEETGNQYAKLARELTAYAIIVMDHCLEHDFHVFDDLHHPSFDSIFATYESHAEASASLSRLFA